jgi:hypothetical protein
VNGGDRGQESKENHKNLQSSQGVSEYERVLPIDRDVLCVCGGGGGGSCQMFGNMRQIMYKTTPLIKNFMYNLIFNIVTRAHMVALHSEYKTYNAEYSQCKHWQM